jgi:hypothetical protein
MHLLLVCVARVVVVLCSKSTLSKHFSISEGRSLQKERERNRESASKDKQNNMILRRQDSVFSTHNILSLLLVASLVLLHGVQSAAQPNCTTLGEPCDPAFGICNDMDTGPYYNCTCLFGASGYNCTTHGNPDRSCTTDEANAIGCADAYCRAVPNVTLSGGGVYTMSNVTYAYICDPCGFGLHAIGQQGPCQFNGTCYWHTTGNDTDIFAGFSLNTVAPETVYRIIQADLTFNLFPACVCCSTAFATPLLGEFCQTLDPCEVGICNATQVPGQPDCPDFYDAPACDHNGQCQSFFPGNFAQGAADFNCTCDDNGWFGTRCERADGCFNSTYVCNGLDTVRFNGVLLLDLGAPEVANGTGSCTSFEVPENETNTFPSCTCLDSGRVINDPDIVNVLCPALIGQVPFDPYYARGCRHCTYVVDACGLYQEFFGEEYCLNGGLCAQTEPGNFTIACNCTGTGFNGTRCENEVNECLSNPPPCGAYGNCTNTLDSFYCNCTGGPAVTGEFCQDIDFCYLDLGQPCQNGGTCNQTSHECLCPLGFEGPTCDSIYSICSRFPRICNTGECFEFETPGLYECDCLSGTNGTNCEGFVRPPCTMPDGSPVVCSGCAVCQTLIFSDYVDPFYGHVGFWCNPCIGDFNTTTGSFCMNEGTCQIRALNSPFNNPVYDILDVSVVSSTDWPPTLGVDEFRYFLFLTTAGRGQFYGENKYYTPECQCNHSLSQPPRCRAPCDDVLFCSDNFNICQGDHLPDGDGRTDVPTTVCSCDDSACSTVNATVFYDSSFNSTVMDPCDPNPCFHGGSCSFNDTTFEINCTDCDEGFTGLRCLTPINITETIDVVCHNSGPCQHGTPCFPGLQTCDSDVDDLYIARCQCDALTATNPVIGLYQGPTCASPVAANDRECTTLEAASKNCPVGTRCRALPDVLVNTPDLGLAFNPWLNDFDDTVINIDLGGAVLPNTDPWFVVLICDPCGFNVSLSNPDGNGPCLHGGACLWDIRTSETPGRLIESASLNYTFVAPDLRYDIIQAFLDTDVFSLQNVTTGCHCCDNNATLVPFVGDVCQTVDACLAGFCNSTDMAGDVNCPDAQTDYVCLHGGTCQSFFPFGNDSLPFQDFNCSCPCGLRGQRCELLDPCCVPETGEPFCVHGSCEIDTLQPSLANCTCDFAWNGTNCNNSIDACIAIGPGYCVNGASCFDDNHFPVCNCSETDGFSGTQCETDIDTCAVIENSQAVSSQFPGYNPYARACNGHGSCFDFPGRDNFTCVCNQGWNSSDPVPNIDDSTFCDIPVGCPCFDEPLLQCVPGVNNTFLPCECIGGFGFNADNTTCLPINDCSETSCRNNTGICSNTTVLIFNTQQVPGHQCNCSLIDFDGPECETQIDDCASPSNPCQHNGECIDGIRSFECNCTSTLYWEGPTCSDNIDDCLPVNPCQNGGICSDLPFGNVTCNCTDTGFNGTFCTNNVNDCTSSTCQNGGRCVDGIQNTTCDCSGTGYNGTECENLIVSCGGNPCVHGSCINIPNNFTCDCGNSGFQGRLCDVNINNCTGVVCQNGGHCVDLTNDYSCVCVPGFDGVLCEHNIDNCTGNPCQNGASCVDGNNTFVCNCLAGFDGVLCEHNIDNCTGNPCQNGASCIDGNNTFTCACLAGFDGVLCEHNIDNCTGNPCQNGGSCVDGNNTFVCACLPGFDGVLCEHNIDNCTGNPCQNGGSCVDGNNTFTCTCLAGFDGVLCEHNIDNCTGNPCQNGASCVDGNNTFTCTCLAGFDGVLCEHNIDNCTGSPCQNGGSCVDGNNTFTCTCPSGYSGIYCQIQAEHCTPNPCLHSGICSNNGASFLCNCNGTGFSGSTCQNNIDNCTGVVCQHGGFCQDGINAFQCLCAQGYSGQYCEIDVDACTPNPCPVLNTTCMNVDMGNQVFTASCIPGDDCLAIRQACGGLPYVRCLDSDRVINGKFLCLCDDSLPNSPCRSSALGGGAGSSGGGAASVSGGSVTGISLDGLFEWNSNNNPSLSSLITNDILFDDIIGLNRTDADLFSTPPADAPVIGNSSSSSTPIGRFSNFFESTQILLRLAHVSQNGSTLIMNGRHALCRSTTRFRGVSMVDLGDLVHLLQLPETCEWDLHVDGQWNFNASELVSALAYFSEHRQSSQGATTALTYLSMPPSRNSELQSPPQPHLWSSRSLWHVRQMNSSGFQLSGASLTIIGDAFRDAGSASSKERHLMHMLFHAPGFHTGFALLRAVSSNSSASLDDISTDKNAQMTYVALNSSPSDWFGLYNTSSIWNITPKTLLLQYLTCTKSTNTTGARWYRGDCL